MLEKITPLILTYNEAPNIERTLAQLTWAKKIIIVDSYSTDDTLEIVLKFPQVTIFHRSFDSFAVQRNYGVEKVETEWVLSLDSDYIITDELIKELGYLMENPLINAYFVNFKYCVFGYPLTGTLLPPRPVLFRKNNSTYVDDGHSELLQYEGEKGRLQSPILHDDRKPLSRWLASQDRYMILEVKKLLETPNQELSLGDRIRRTKILAPFVILFYCLILKGCILDGWRGWYYTFQRVLAELWLSVRLIEAEQMGDSCLKK